MSFRRFLIPILLALLVSTSPAWAHDFFLLPSRFHANIGDSLRIFVHVSDTFPGVPQDWNPERVARFTHKRYDKETDLTTIKPEGTPLGPTVVVHDSGTHLFALDWKARFIELKPDQFLGYLRSEGLESIIRLRENRGETERAGRERYSRYVKTMMQIGNKHPPSVLEPVGQKIEIVPLSNPYKLHTGDSVRVQILFEGKPLRDALVSATYAGFTKKADMYAQSFRTNEEGTAIFRLTHPGAWMVRVVHMIPLIDSSDADWESFWASLTFEVRN